MNTSSNKFFPHLIAVLIFILIPSFYFPDTFQGKKINQSDISGYKGMAKEIQDFREETGEEALWTNSMFGGMPAYLIDMKTPFNVFGKINQIFTFQKGRPIIHVVLYMFGFYILLLLFGINPWLGIIGGIAYGFSSYFFIILEPGHLTKAMAIGYMPMIIGSVYYTFKKDILTGAILTSIFIGLQVVVNHLQITYYTLLFLLIFGIFELIEVSKNKTYLNFLKALGALILAVILSVSVNIVNLWSVSEYSEYSLRGPSELTNNSEDKTSGLDKSYATGWSYGVDETLNLLIPNFKGGSSGVLMADRDSETFKFLSRSSNPQQAVQIINQNPYFFTQYWGSQPGTSGPVYLGATIVFLFVFGMFFLKGRLRWMLFSVVMLSVLLSWGKNFMFLTDFFLDYFPGYNKFRTVSMILVLAELAFPLLAILAINKLLFEEYSKKEFMNSLKFSAAIVGGIALIFALFPTLSNLSSPRDAILTEQGASDLVHAIEKDRAKLLSADAFRSLVFVLLTGALIYFYSLKKFNVKYFYIALGLVLLVDLWPVNKRYLNSDDFVRKAVVKTPFQPNAADMEILKDKDLYYRVYDITAGDPFSSSRASYFHKSLGGYHGAKMRRYQEVFDRYMKGELNDGILNMLNTKYLIQRDNNTGQAVVVKRSGNLGNAWFVSNIMFAENADEEIKLLGEIDPATSVTIDKRYEEYLDETILTPDSTAEIKLVEYAPNKLKYEYRAESPQVVIFSDIYYPKGWTATIDGEEASYFRANYILRGMQVPEGERTISFEFKPKSYFTGSKISIVASILLILLVIGGIVRELRLQKGKQE